MDAPVEKLGAPAEPLGPSGAPDFWERHSSRSHRARPMHIHTCRPGRVRIRHTSARS